MARKSYSRRYAQAVFEIAQEKKELERWQSDLDGIAGALGNAAFRAALESPKLGFEDKSRLISAQLSKIGPLALNLVRLLVSRDRLDIIADIAVEYRGLVDAYHGIARAEVVTAVPFAAADEEKVAGYLGALTGKKVIVASRVEPGIIGGVIARVGGELLDGSTRRQLAALKKELAGAEG